MKGKLDFFTALYAFMCHENAGLRAVTCQTFNQIMVKLSRASIGFNLFTKAATNNA